MYEDELKEIEDNFDHAKYFIEELINNSEILDDIESIVQNDDFDDHIKVTLITHRILGD